MQKIVLLQKLIQLMQLMQARKFKSLHEQQKHAQKKSLYDDYANANKKCFFHIIFKILTLKNDANDPWHVGVRDLK